MSQTPLVPIKFRLRYEPDATPGRTNDSSMIEESEFTDVPGWMLLDLATRAMRHVHGAAKPSGHLFIRGIAQPPGGLVLQHRMSIHTRDLETNQQALREMFLAVREAVREKLAKFHSSGPGRPS